jgi:hypothetical protein
MQNILIPKHPPNHHDGVRLLIPPSALIHYALPLHYPCVTHTVFVSHPLIMFHCPEYKTNARAVGSTVQQRRSSNTQVLHKIVLQWPSTSSFRTI